ncbi:MAG: ABC transporter permease [Cuspidothrix sp.]
MKKNLKQFFTLLSVHYAYLLEYRSELLLWVLAGSLPIIMMGIWDQASKSGKFPFSSIDFIRYFFAVFLSRQMTTAWVIYDFEKEVLEGKLSLKLLQTIDPVWHHITIHLSEKLARIPFVLMVSILFFVLYPQAIWLPSLANILLFILALTMAFSLRFIIQYTFAMFAFWTERTAALENLWLLFFIFLSGLIAPLDVFPQSIRTLAMLTPFPYIINFPASILVGLPVNLHGGFLSILGWFFIFLGANRLLWRMGLKHYSGMGA